MIIHTTIAFVYGKSKGYNFRDVWGKGNLSMLCAYRSEFFASNQAQYNHSTDDGE